MRMSKKPLIGIAPTILKQKKTSDWIGTYRSYIESVQNAGGEPIILTPNIRLAPYYLNMLDGLLLTGGADIHPKYFGQKIPRKGKIDLSPEERTSFELAMVKGFLKRKKPLLGICLGCQTMNIALGGDLIQDLPTERPQTRNHKIGNHSVSILHGTKFQRLIGRKMTSVNSRHHQAVGRLGRGMRISALSKDGVIEAIEVLKHPFAIGVQWHPEIMNQRAESKRIFGAFVKACRVQLS